MAIWTSEQELFALMKEKLYTPVVGDILDEIGYVHQFLPQEICPIKEGMKLAGRAMTVLMIDVFGPQKKPFGLLTEALDQLQEGEIYLATGGTGRCAYWGELLTATARTRGAVGAVVNGYHRDTPRCWNRTGLCSHGGHGRRIPPCVHRWWISAARLR